MANKRKDKSGVKKSNEKKSPLREQNKAKEIKIEDNHPGVTEQIHRFGEAELPLCPHCGSSNTASVQVGIIGRSITIAASTTKVKLVPNVEDRLGKYFCHNCKKFFD